jgi:hypothetical protein
MVDCVRINEYFGDIERTRVCRCHTWKRDGVRRIPINCPKGIADSDKTPELCDNDRCRWNIWKEVSRPKVLIQCFEIKITKSDFKSKNGHNFVGNLNYYVIPRSYTKPSRTTFRKKSESYFISKAAASAGSATRYSGR